MERFKALRHGLTEEQDPSGDSLGDSFLVAGAEGQELSEGGLVGRRQPEQLRETQVLSGAKDPDG